MAAKKKAVTDGLLGQLSRRQWELFDQMRSGALDPKRTLDALQAVLDGGSIRELLYTQEREESTITYPSRFNYCSVKEQLLYWKEIYPELDRSYVLMLSRHPELKEFGPFAVVPKPDSIVKDSNYIYYEALLIMLEQIAKFQRFQNWISNCRPDDIHFTEATSKAYRAMDQFPGDFWVFPFQFGMKWRGASVRHAQARFLPNEFGLGPYEVAALLLIHPTRITGQNNLDIDCAGCEYDSLEDRSNLGYINFRWNLDYKCLNISNHGERYRDPNLGSATGFMFPL